MVSVDTCDTNTQPPHDDVDDGANDRVQRWRKRATRVCLCARAMVGSSDPFDFVDACVELEQMHVSEGREDGVRCVRVAKRDDDADLCTNAARRRALTRTDRRVHVQERQSAWLGRR